MIEKSSNPIAIQSQERIISALVELMETKNFSAITMQMIADKGKIGRRTIYSHFSSKEDILESFISKISMKYIQELGNDNDFSYYKLAVVFFSFFQKNIKTLNILKRNNLMIYLLDKFDDTLNMIITTHLSEYLSSFSDNYRSYFIAFYSGCYWKLLCQWLDNGAKNTPVEMADILSSILGGIEA